MNMCKLIVGINKGNPEKIKEVLEIEKEAIFGEPHGLGAMVVTKDNRVLVFRDFLFYDNVYQKLLAQIDKCKMFAIHSRTSTGGTVGQLNVHFFESEGYLFAHNGFVSEYSTWKKANEKCDSFQFLEGIKKPFTKEDLQAFMVEKKFTHSAGFMFNKANKEAYLMVEKTVKAIDDDGFSMFFSYTPDLSRDMIYYKDVCGVHVENGEETIELPYETKDVIKGVYKLKF